jgi:hypothetical protein
MKLRMEQLKNEIYKQINRINELFGNDGVSGKHLCVVDIQPEYENAFGQMLPEFINFLNFIS